MGNTLREFRNAPLLNYRFKDDEQYYRHQELVYSVAPIVLNVGYVFVAQQCAAETDLKIVLTVRKSLFLDKMGKDFT